MTFDAQVPQKAEFAYSIAKYIAGKIEKESESWKIGVLCNISWLKVPLTNNSSMSLAGFTICRFDILFVLHCCTILKLSYNSHRNLATCPFHCSSKITYFH